MRNTRGPIALVTAIVVWLVANTNADACSPEPVDPFTRFDAADIVAIGRVQGGRFVLEQRWKGPARPWFALDGTMIGRTAGITPTCQPILADGSRVLLFFRRSQETDAHVVVWAESPSGAAARVLRTWSRARDATRRAEVLASFAFGESRTQRSFAIEYLARHRRLLAHVSADERARLEHMMRARQVRRLRPLDS